MPVAFARSGDDQLFQVMFDRTFTDFRKLSVKSQRRMMNIQMSIRTWTNNYPV